jgi:S1-C subfamily serine protease
MTQALAGDPLARPFVGIRYVSIDAKVQRDEDLPVDHGALIGPATNAAGETLPAIAPGSPAEAAGLRDGDIVLTVEDQTIDAEHPLDAVLAGFAPGQTVSLTIRRGDEQLRLPVTLGTRPDGL